MKLETTESRGFLREKEEEGPLWGCITGSNGCITEVLEREEREKGSAYVEK